MALNITHQPAGVYEFGSKTVEINGNQYILQDFSISRPSNIVELEGSQGEVIACVSVQKLEELSGSFVKETAKPDPALGDTFTLEGKEYFLVETSESRSNGSFAIISFSAREVIS